MRILNVSAQKPDSTGSGTYLTALVRSQVAAGHEAAVVCGIDEGDSLAAVPAGAKVFPVRFMTDALPFHVCGMSDVMPYAATRYRDLTSPMVEAFERAFSATIDRAVADFEPDVVICHHLYLLCAIVRERVTGIPVTAISHSTDLRQLRQHPLGRERVAEAVRRLDGVCALHDAQVREITRMFSVDPARVTVVGVGFDPQVFHPDPAVERMPGTVAFVGKVCAAKGAASLMRAVALMELRGCAPESVAMAGGWGSSQEESDAVRALAASLATPVDFLGHVSPAELSARLCATDTFVLPSFFEGLPLVSVEAIACGCKDVLSDLPGVRPWLDAELPDAPVRWVAPPPMVDVDKPLPEALPAYEGRLADALAASLAAPVPAAPDASALTWGAVDDRVLASVGL